MSYTDELIRQELERYWVSLEPITEKDIEDFRANMINLTEDKARIALKYIFGRSWYWFRLMRSLDLPVITRPEKLNIPVLLNYSVFEIGILVTMRQLGNPITESKPIQVTMPEPVKTSKPKHKGKK